MDWLSRFVTTVAFLAVGVIFSPETLGSGDLQSPKLETFLKLAHLLSFSTAWGAALWVTFIGIIMFKNLPRHLFGNLRSKIFPPYFAMVGVCTAVSVAAFGYLHPWKKSSPSTEKYQLGFLASSFAFNLANLFVFMPMTIQMMKQRHKIEREEKIGEEVGWVKNQEAAKNNPKLAAMNTKFGIIHGFSALAHIMSTVSLAMHSWYLAGKLNL